MWGLRLRWQPWRRQHDMSHLLCGNDTLAVFVESDADTSRTRDQSVTVTSLSSVPHTTWQQRKHVPKSHLGFYYFIYLRTLGIPEVAAPYVRRTWDAYGRLKRATAKSVCARRVPHRTRTHLSVPRTTM